MLRTPFHEFHAEHGASFVGFAGWEMPLHYGSIVAEHHHVRDAGGLFDVSHMGRITFRGPDASRLLERVLTRRVSDMSDLTCRYGLVCNEAGGALDDVICYRFPEHWMLVVNASNRAKLLDHFERVGADHQVQIEDRTEQTAMIACQGPRVIELLGRYAPQVVALKRFGFCQIRFLTLEMIISRTGYTGEDGVEVIMDTGAADAAIRLLAKTENTSLMRPAGLGARDTLRIEAAMPLYGHELDEQTDPIAARLAFAVTLDKGDEDSGGPQIPGFIGQAALRRIEAVGPARHRVGVRLEGRRTPRQGMTVLIGDDPRGHVTSGCLSPTLGYPIAMAYVERDACGEGDAATVAIGSKRVDGQVVRLPFYKR